MNAGRKLRLATRLRHAKLGAALTSPYVASFIGCFILAASWVHFVSGLDVPPWTSVLIVLWAMFLAACQVLISSADGEADAEILRELLEDELQAGALRHEELARQIAVAITYRTNLQTALKIGGREDSSRIAGTLERIDDWLLRLGRLAGRVDSFKTGTAFQSGQMFELRQRIVSLETRAAEVTDVRLIGQLRETIARRRHQLRMVEELDGLLERGLLSLEHAVASVGSVCAQLALVSSNEDDLTGTPPLAADINVEIEQVDTILAAIERVQSLPRQLAESARMP